VNGKLQTMRKPCHNIFDRGPVRLGPAAPTDNPQGAHSENPGWSPSIHGLYFG
jgi:hypothetical protein